MKKLLIISMFVMGSLSFAAEGTNDVNDHYTNAASQYNNEGILEVDEIDIEVPVLNLTDKQAKEINKIINKYNKDYDKAEKKIDTIEKKIAEAYVSDDVYGNSIENLLEKKYKILSKLEKEYIKSDKKINQIINN